MLTLWTTTESSKFFTRHCKPLLNGHDQPAKIVYCPKAIPPEVPPGIIVAMGSKLLKTLANEGIVHKNRTIASLRGIPHKFQDSTIFVTYGPEMVDITADSRDEILWDLALATRYNKTGSLTPPLGTYTEVPDLSPITEWASSLTKPTALSMDLETVGADPFGPTARILCASFTVEDGQSWVYWWPESGVLPPEVQTQIATIVTHPKIKLQGSNFKYDMLWLKVHCNLWPTNLKFDTYLVGSLLDENRSNSLKFHAKTETTMGGYSDEFDRKYDKDRMDLIPRDEVTLYAGADTDACHRVARSFRRQILEDKQLSNFYVNLLLPSSQVFAKMEHRGVVVDMERYKLLRKQVVAKLEQVQRDALKIIPGRICAKYSDNLSITRAKLLCELFFSTRGFGLEPLMKTPKGDAPSTALEHMMMFKNDPKAGPFVSLLAEYSKTKKILTSYVDGFMKHLRADGKFHPSYRMGVGGDEGDGEGGGTNTGRTSAKDPAYQTLVKRGFWAKPLREVYVPPPGMAILKFDYSQGELRIIADVANEPTMIKAYQQGIDLHAITASILKHLTLDEFYKLSPDEIELARYGGKAGNFGLVYGMQAEGFRDYAEAQYNFPMTLEEAEEFRNGFFNKYSRLTDWHEETKTFAKLHGYVRNPLGRIRHLPMVSSPVHSVRSKSLRQSLNAPIQSCLSDAMQLAMIELDRRYPDLWIFGMTHDSCEMYVPEDEVMEWGKRIKEVAENLPFDKFGWSPKVKLVVDVEASTVNLASCKKLKFAA